MGVELKGWVKSFVASGRKDGGVFVGLGRCHARELLGRAGWTYLAQGSCACACVCACTRVAGGVQCEVEAQGECCVVSCRVESPCQGRDGVSFRDPAVTLEAAPISRHWPAACAKSNTN